MNRIAGPGVRLSASAVALNRGNGWCATAREKTNLIRVGGSVEIAGQDAHRRSPLAFGYELHESPHLLLTIFAPGRIGCEVGRDGKHGSARPINHSTERDVWVL